AVRVGALSAPTVTARRYDVVRPDKRCPYLPDGGHPAVTRPDIRYRSSKSVVEAPGAAGGSPYPKYSAGPVQQRNRGDAPSRSRRHSGAGPRSGHWTYRSTAHPRTGWAVLRGPLWPIRALVTR